MANLQENVGYSTFFEGTRPWSRSNLFLPKVYACCATIGSLGFFLFAKICFKFIID